MSHCVKGKGGGLGRTGPWGSISLGFQFDQTGQGCLSWDKVDFQTTDSAGPGWDDQVFSFMKVGTSDFPVQSQVAQSRVIVPDLQSNRVIIRESDQWRVDGGGQVDLPPRRDQLFDIDPEQVPRVDQLVGPRRPIKNSVVCPIQGDFGIRG